MNCHAAAIMVASIAFIASAACLAEENVDAPKSRRFQLDYGATLEGLPAGARIRVWLPVPLTSEYQKIDVLKMDLPAEGQIATESTNGNQILYFETTSPPSGRLAFSMSYDVHRQEIRGLSGAAETRRLTDEQRKLFLAANRKVPLHGKQLSLLEGLDLSGEPLSVAKQLYERVDAHVRYDKSQPGYGNGDVPWVCDSRTGNCTDFHSLFISLSRARGLPARFEIGFPLPPERGAQTIGGYHCWALFYVNERGWVPVDISEADKHPELKQYYFGNLNDPDSKINKAMAAAETENGELTQLRSDKNTKPRMWFAGPAPVEVEDDIPREGESC